MDLLLEACSRGHPPAITEIRPWTAPTIGREGMIVTGATKVNTDPRVPSAPNFLFQKPGKSKQPLENVGLEPHVSLRPGAPKHHCVAAFTLIIL
jgi:hypothetical protein